MGGGSSFLCRRPQTHKPERRHSWWPMRCPHPAGNEEVEVNGDSNRLGWITHLRGYGMQTRWHLRWISATILLFAASGANAQNLTITNARILDGTGRVIERGAVVVRDGKIVSVSAAAPAAGGGRTIDARGKTVMPGLIDAHRHIVTGNPAEWLTQRAAQQLQEFLEAGFTTVLAAIDPPQAIEARKRS